MIHDIIVPIQIDPSRRPWAAESYAISLASTFNARLTAMAPTLAPALPGMLGVEIPSEIIEEMQRRSDADAQKALSRFEECARAAGVVHHSVVARAGLAEFADLFAVRTRTCDLAVVPQPQGEGVRERELVQAVLFDSGRPVLVVPYIHQGEARFERVLFAWDGSAQAARAVHDAIPLLDRASTVKILTISTEKHRTKDASPGTELAAHLMRHGLQATARTISGIDVGVSEALLSHAADAGTDLVIMGGYAHSRLRDLVFGGATLGMLDSMTVPVLMAH